MPLEEQVKALPDKPGVYLMKDAAGKIIYVGKAVSLKNRVRSYFHASNSQTPKVRRMVSQIASFEYIITHSELEALILECNLIKQHRPKYNILLKDDKQYPYIKVTLNEAFPRVVMTRLIRKDGAKYYGPYTDVSAVHETLRLLKRIFPLRQCNRQIGRDEGRPCLNYHIKRCLAPCQGRVEQEAYDAIIKEVCLFLEGRQEDLLKRLEEKMYRAAENLEFERAAEIRNQIQAVEKIIAKQKIISAAMEDQDVIAFAQEDDEACVQIFFIRGGKLIGREHFLLDDIAEMDAKEIMTAFIKQYYTTASFVPREIFLQHEIDELNIIENWLTGKRGAKVYIRVPKKGEKHKLIEMVAENAAEVLRTMQIKAKRQREMTSGAVEALQEVLCLDELPYRIEAYDISNISGTEAVGSMVVFEGGKPKNSDYRRFRIKTVQGANDFAMMQEVLRRRFQRGLDEREELAKETDQAPKAPKFAVFPDLVLIDGGKGQLNAAREVMRDLGVDHIPAIGLAKEFEHIFIEGEPDPLILPRNSDALRLLQRVRDEAHRFAITYHRTLRQQRTITSALDAIPGIGEKRRKALLIHFGSVDKVKEASVEELAAVEGMNRKAAEAVYNFFRRGDNK